jgi:hypothetical protein
MKDHKKPQTWTDFLDEGPNRKKMDMRFGTWNVRSTYRAGSLTALAEEISKYKLDIVGVQEVRWDGGGTKPACEYTFFMKRGMIIMKQVRGFSYIRESYQQLRG